MTTVFILMGEGFGDDEYAFEPVSVHSTRERAEAALAALAEQTELDHDSFRIDEYAVDGERLENSNIYE